MILKTKLFGESMNSSSKKLAKNNEYKSGDRLAGVTAESSERCGELKVVLSQLKLSICLTAVCTIRRKAVTHTISLISNPSNLWKILRTGQFHELREWIFG